jgi:saccharopine dehydrogenase-like NADP-dependent oxidoreductase
MGNKVFVLGGAGLMGSEVTRDLLNEPDIDQVTIGEIEVGRAQAMAEELYDPRVSVVQADVRDTAGCAELARGYDLLMNCTFFELFGEALSVACEAGTTYADLLSTPTPEHHRQAKDASIMAVSGLGATPGMTNILGRMGCESFDEPESVEISWASFRPIAHSPGLLGGMFWEMGPECETRQFFRNGRFVKAGAFEGSKQIDFEYPIGKQTVYYMAHTETVALPKYFPELNFVCVRGTWRPAQMEVLRVLGEHGLMDFEQQDTSNGPVDVAQFTMDRIWAARAGELDEEAWGFFLDIEVGGRSEGRSGTTRFRISHPVDWREKATAKMTGIPAAVQAAMVMRQGPSRSGIVDATGYFTDPAAFLERLKARGTVEVQQETVWGDERADA